MKDWNRGFSAKVKHLKSDHFLTKSEGSCGLAYVVNLNLIKPHKILTENLSRLF